MTNAKVFFGKVVVDVVDANLGSPTLPVAPSVAVRQVTVWTYASGDGSRARRVVGPRRLSAKCKRAVRGIDSRGHVTVVVVIIAVVHPFAIVLVSHAVRDTNGGDAPYLSMLRGSSR